MTSAPVRWHCTMSLDGYVAGPGDDMSFLAHGSPIEGLVERYAAQTGAILVGRRAYDAYVDDPSMQYYGGAWSGPQFVLTHRPDSAVARPGWTILSGPLDQALRTVQEAGRGKAIEIVSASIAAQAIDAGLVDEIHVHIAPVLLGAGVPLFPRIGDGQPLGLEMLESDATGDILTGIYRPRQ